MSPARGPAVRRHRQPRPPVTALVAFGAALCLAAGSGVGRAATGPPPPPTARDAPPAATGQPPSGGRPGCAGGCGSAPPAPSGTPTRVRVPRIGVDSPLTVLGLDRDRALVPPADFDVAGWYGDGPAPGDPGPAVLAGHLDSRRGPAVFARLDELRAGDTVEVRRGGQWLPFRVTGSQRTRKDRFPTAAVYGPTPGPELRLITCGGDFDRRRRHYVDNVVVFAVAEPAR
ncbi:class F sortase [Micromonospora sp. NPDC005367]|uniref:class F sortase n=1 Tax=Micromonospora sp. NPDC005367 TaxID=3155590 RepID=UPI0033BBBEAC